MGQHDGCEKGQHAILSIGTTNDDGTAHIRYWKACAACALQIAADLGPPDAESLATQEARQNASQLIAGMPGYLLTTAGEA